MDPGRFILVRIMEEAEIVAGLKAKRADLVAEMERTRGDIAANDRTIELITGKRSKTIRAPGVTTGLFDRNELKTLVLKSFRENPKRTVDELVRYVVDLKRIDLSIPDMYSTMVKRIHAHFVVLRRDGLVVEDGSVGGGLKVYALVD